MLSLGKGAICKKYKMIIFKLEIKFKVMEYLLPPVNHESSHNTQNPRTAVNTYEQIRCVKYNYN